MKVRPTGPITCNRCGIILVGVFMNMRGKPPRPAIGLHCTNCKRTVEIVTVIAGRAPVRAVCWARQAAAGRLDDPPPGPTSEKA